jgi:hypothetical protein
MNGMKPMIVNFNLKSSFKFMRTSFLLTTRNRPNQTQTQVQMQICGAVETIQAGTDEFRESDEGYHALFEVRYLSDNCMEHI